MLQREAFEQIFFTGVHLPHVNVMFCIDKACDISPVAI